ncbi:MAG: tetratricopeptide repeat protein [Spirochaetaceae bacterium]|jgi:tetratricopeptide (TPR) repeat protein|nr:tetratricopeptide repeat protein [Spirochaetaceae bacterium]
METGKEEIHSAEDKTDVLYSFFEKNRKVFFISGVVIIVLLAGFITALIVRDEAQKSATARLDILVERYKELKDISTESGTGEDDIAGDGIYEEEAAEEVAIADTEAFDSLLKDLRTLGNEAAGYPAARAWFMAADIYHERGEWQEARDAWLAAADKGGAAHITPVCLFNAAVAGEAAGDLDSALANYKKALSFSDFPAAAHAQFSVGRIEETRGDAESAIAAYRDLIDKWPAETEWTNLAHSRLIFLELPSNE